jgi:putative transcriptional regulator
MTNSIRVARAIAGLTQSGLAQLVGVSRQTIIAIEGGKYVPSTVLALKLAKVLGKDPGTLFELEDADWIT